MVDITMCNGHGCKQAGSCYRYTAQPNPWRQSYFLTSPLTGPTSCTHFDDNAGAVEYHLPVYLEKDIHVSDFAATLPLGIRGSHF